MRRVLLTVAIALVEMALLVSPARAAGATVDSSNFHTRLVAVDGRPPGVGVKVIEIGNRLELVNRTRTEIVVLGYEDEPYLRVGPEGVFENRRSPATYLNRDRQATSAVPEDAAPDAPPEWRKVSDGPTARWYDHRVHGMGAIQPPTVRQEPGERHVIIPEWTVPFRYGDGSFAATGELVWEPGPSAVPWLMLASVPAGVALLLVGASLWSGRRSTWSGPIAFGVVLLIAVSAVAGIFREPPRLPPTLMAAWFAAAVATVLLVWGQRKPGLYLVALSAAGIAVFGGAALVQDLSRSQVPTRLPIAMARASVAGSLGLGLALVCVALLALGRSTIGDSHLLREQ